MNEGSDDEAAQLDTVGEQNATAHLFEHFAGSFLEQKKRERIGLKKVKNDGFIRFQVAQGR